ncbi:MAG TPA: ankyrin repeat domain-containing protein [Jatrophihabitans sp.]|nr:ankyrin repeat domain-containing protein [Jatrophihabitans sp.]
MTDDGSEHAVITAIRAGDLPGLRQLLTDQPGLATARFRGRSLLHIATDWPGHRPDVAATIAILVAAGADPNSRFDGEHSETPLHWAASNDDTEAVDALLDAGADIDAPGAVIAGGTPMADATAFGQWNAARRLVERGAATNLFEAAALGLLDRVEHHLAGRPTAEDVTSSFWGACHGGQVGTAAVLLESGADLDWVGYDGLTPLDAARRAGADDVVGWLLRHGARSASSQT